MAYVPDEADDRESEVGGKAFKLFIHYCKRADSKTGKSFAASRKIASEKGWTLNRLYEFRKELVDAKWIAADGDNVTVLFGFPRPNRYENRTNADTKNVSSQVRKSSLRDTKNVPAKSDKRTKTSTITVPAYKEEPNHEPIQLTKPTEPESKPLSDADQVFEFWKVERKHPQSKFTKERKKAVDDRMKEGFTVDQIQTAIRGLSLSPHHMGQNKNRTVYDDLELICRTGGKVESFIHLFEHPPNQNGNGANGNGQDQSKSAIASRERAANFTGSIDYYSRRVEAAHSRSSSNAPVVKRIAATSDADRGPGDGE